MDKVLIEGLRVEALIGVYAWERETRQTLVIDLVMAWDNRVPGQSDDVEHALDYGKVAEKVTSWVGNSAFHLVEALAEDLAGRLRAEFGMIGLRLTVRKPGAVTNAFAVGVEIARGVEI